MAIIALNVKVGQAVQIGNAACVAVKEKKGAQVKLIISTALSPVLLIPTGIFPPPFRPPGITGAPDPVADQRVFA